MLLTLMLGANAIVHAQTINTTYALGAAQTSITFAVQNTNAFPVQLTSVNCGFQATSNGGTFTLWASTTSLSGAPTIASPTWSVVASGPISANALAVFPVLTGLSYVIPAGTTVRFAAQATTTVVYGGATSTPNLFSAGGINLLVGSSTVSGLPVGYGGAFPTPTIQPRFFAGSLTFAPISPCTGTPTPGSTTSNVLAACTGQTLNLGLQNATTGSGVSYQWEFDNGGGWTPFGTNSATASTTQTVATSYRCTVTCTEPGGGSQSSTPITIPMSTNAFPVEFEQIAFPSNCWTRSGTAAGFLTRDNANGFGLTGTGSAKWDFWNGTLNTTQVLTSIELTPIGANKQITFDVAGAKFTDASVDTIRLQASSSGIGGPWTTVVEMTNALGGDLNTAGALGAAFTPSAAQWVNRSFPIPAGTNAIRFASVAGFGNNVFIDNIDLEDILQCPTPDGLSATLTGTTTANISWNTNAATSYEIEVRSSGAPGSGPVGLAVSGSGILAPPFAASTLTFGQSYQAYVRGDCGANGLSQWSAPLPFSMDYCAGSAVVGTNNPIINNFTFAGINNTNASNAGFLDFTAQVAEVPPGISTPFSLDRVTDFALDTAAIWIDLNGDIDFNDPGELVALSPSLFPDPWNGTITIPNGTTAGPKRLRIRRWNMTPGFDYPVDPCGTAPFGQVQDYTVNVCGAVLATASVTDNCGSNTFTVDVNITSLGSGASATINYTVNGTPQTAVIGGVGITTLGGAGFNAGDQVSITIDNGTPCTLDLGDHFSNCPVTIACGNTVTVDHCYRNGDPRTWTFTSSNPLETVTVSFISGSMAGGDVIRAYDGTNNLGTPILSLTGNFISLAGAFGTSSGPSIFIEIDSDASGSCADGGATSWQFEAECTAGCIDPEGAVSVITDCANYNFTIDVEVISTGEVVNTALEYTVNGGTPIVIPGLVSSDIGSIGPFNIDDNVLVRLLHGSDPLCNKTLGTFTDDDSCVPGELCISAIPLGVNPNGACPAAGTPGSNAIAIADGGSFSCSASTGPFLDKWYRFNSGSNTAIGYTFSSFTFTSLLVEVFQGSCGGPSVFCATGVAALNNSFATTPNTDYWLRMASGAGQGGAFSVCVFAAPPPFDPCASVSTIPACDLATGPVAVAAGTGAWSNNTLGGPYQTPGREQIFTFTAAVSGTYAINVLQYIGGDFVDFYWKVAGTCNNSGWNYLSDVGATGVVAADVANGGSALTFTAGTTYYIMWDTENTSGRTVDFQINCPVVAPDNDLCANAIPIGCNSVTSGSTLGSSAIGNPGTCTTTLNTAGGVWYTVQGWDGQMTASLCGSGFDTKIGVLTGSCGAFNCVAGNDDECGLQSSVSWAATSGTTYYIYVTGFGAATGSFTLTVTCGDTNPACTTNGLTLEMETDANFVQTSWEIVAQGTNVVALSGNNLPAQGVITQSVCLPDGCYRLRVLDAGGDGIAGGGYILRTNAGDRIIDNRDNFTNGSVSAVIGNGGFCLPLGTDKLIYTSCDKLDWVNNQFIVAAENPAVSAQWQVGNQTDDGYQFWWFDPNGSYGYTKFRSHATSDGFGPANAIRACHARINNWSPNQVPANVLMNVKVRSRVNGNNSAWGPVCRFKIDPVTAACPLTKLMDIPGNQFYSCGVTRTWGGNNRVHARPVDGATQYQFRFNNGELAAPVIRTVTTYYLNLNWTPALPNGTYQVQVRAFKNGAWCVTSLPWGDECNVTIVGSTAMTQNGDGTVSTGDAKLAMFPNPNRGDLLTLSLSAVEEGVNTVSVDIFDLTGAVVSSRTIAVNDGMVYQVLELNEMASGLYMVNITAGTQRYTERLVISK
jgi:hypothetical protein